jgi:hypothetical protein
MVFISGCISGLVLFLNILPRSGQEKFRTGMSLIWFLPGGRIIGNKTKNFLLLLRLRLEGKPNWSLFQDGFRKAPEVKKWTYCPGPGLGKDKKEGGTGKITGKDFKSLGKPGKR